MTMTAREICAAVAQKHGLKPEAIRQHGKECHVVRARDEAIATVRRDRKMSYPAIGRLFGMHHTSVMAACRRADPAAVLEERPRLAASDLMQEIMDLRRRVEFLENQGLGLA